MALCNRRKRKAKAKECGRRKFANVRGRLDVFKDSVTYEANSPYAIYCKQTFQEFDTKSIPFNTKNGLTQATFEKNILYILLSFINCICHSIIPHNFTSLLYGNPKRTRKNNIKLFPGECIRYGPISFHRCLPY